jgi:hypothetical protein
VRVHSSFVVLVLFRFAVAAIATATATASFIMVLGLMGGGRKYDGGMETGGLVSRI